MHPNRQARLTALSLIQKQSSITKEASVIDFLKETFQAFYRGIESQVDKNHPVLSVLNFLSVGIITSYSPILGMIFSILGSSFGINFESIFLKIKEMLTPHLKSEESIRNLDVNQDTIINNTVKTAVGQNVKQTDEEIDSTLQQISEEAKSSTTAKLEYGLIVKEGAIGAALIQKFLPTIGKAFGGGRNWIVALLVWIVKGVLLGGGIIGATSAMSSVFGVTPKSKEQSSTEEHSTSNSSDTAKPSDTTSNETSTGTATVSSMSQIIPHIREQLKLSNDSGITMSRPNNAPNDQTYGVDGGQQWMVTGNFANTLYRWIFSTYANAAEVLSRNNISPEALRNAAKRVADEFSRDTNYPTSTDLHRIPKEYDNVKDVVDLIISRVTK